MTWDRFLKRQLPPVVVAMAALAAHAAIFLPFLPTEAGTAGADYGYFLPQLLAGYFWFERNGLFSVPWFTPAFCGGVPYYPNMQGLYFSLPQLATFAVGPIRALHVTFLICAGAGLGGFYILLRRMFVASTWMALAGAVLFLFNGFFAYRLLAGHLTFHAFMLMPLVAAGALASERPGAVRRPIDIWVLGAGLVIAYMVQSSMIHALPPALLAVTVIVLVHALLFGFRWMPLVRLGIAGGVGLLLSIAKLAAALAFVEQFPREMLPLSGFASIWQVAAVAAHSLFIAPAFSLGAQWLTNNQWYADTRVLLAYHEFEYGVTYVPALIIAAWLIHRALGFLRRGRPAMPGRDRFMLLVAIALLLSLPLVVNWYEPTWNALLKRLPLLRSSSTLVRWFCMYVPVVILIAALIVDRTKLAPPVRTSVALVIIGSVVLMNATADRRHYRHDEGGYDLRPVNEAFLAVRHGAPVPSIGRIDWLDGSMPYSERMSRRDRNDSLLSGGSQAECYEPMFGHELEEFPFGPLREGPALDARDGLLNVKNPACLIYPDANACRPGDHFSDDEIEAARAFLSYRPFAFALPWWQRAANWINLSSLVAVLGGIAFYAGAALRLAVPGRVRRTG